MKIRLKRCMIPYEKRKKNVFWWKSNKRVLVLHKRLFSTVRNTYAHLTFLSFGFFSANRGSWHCQQKKSLSELRELFWMRQKRLQLNQKRLVGCFFLLHIAICQKYKFTRWRKFECEMNQMLPTWIRWMLYFVVSFDYIFLRRARGKLKQSILIRVSPQSYSREP